MKKVFALLMAAAIILSLAACGNKNPDSNPDSNDDSNDKKTTLILGEARGAAIAACAGAGIPVYEYPSRSVKQALSWAARLKPKRTILTHMTSELDYQKLANELPEGVEPAYDGMVVTFT